MSEFSYTRMRCSAIVASARMTDSQYLQEDSPARRARRCKGAHMPNVDEFLNPKSMLAPGIAGATTMAITNAVAANFDLSRPWLGLVVSGLFAAAAVAYAQ